MNKYYPHLFSNGKLGRITTKNRTVMASMGDNMANADGSVSDESIAYYAARARGGTAVIIPGVFSVDYPTGKTIPCQHRIDNVKFVKNLHRLAVEIHRYDSLLIPQIHHAGASTDYETTEGEVPVGVSSDEEKEEGLVSIAAKTDEEIGANAFRVLTTEDIKELEKKYIQAAVYCKLAECDGIEIHGAHGYLISQFINSKVNKRKDEYGGPIENRGRFVVNIIEGIRKACGPDFIVGVRTIVHGWDTDGITDEESIKLAQMYEAAGADYLNISGGFTPTITNLLETGRYEQGDRLFLADKIRKYVSVPVMCAGVIREPAFAEKIIADGRVDFALMGRTLIADPDWANKAEAGHAEQIRPCISCLDACYGNLACGHGVRCCLNPTVGRENELALLKHSVTPGKVAVIGGGIAGMTAAMYAAELGHDVTLFEKSDTLSGQMNIACLPPHKQYIKWAIEWAEKETARRGVKIKLGTEATEEVIRELNPDNVIVAAGALPSTFGIPGADKALPAWDVLKGCAEIPDGSSVIVLGGGIVGCETAEALVEKKCKVTVLEMTDGFANGLEGANKIDILGTLNRGGANLMANAKVDCVEGGKVIYNSDQEVCADYVVCALGEKPVGRELAEKLKEDGFKVSIIGDAKRPRKFYSATQEGYMAAINL